MECDYVGRYPWNMAMEGALSSLILQKKCRRPSTCTPAPITERTRVSQGLQTHHGYIVCKGMCPQLRQPLSAA